MILNVHDKLASKVILEWYLEALRPTFWILPSLRLIPEFLSVMFFTKIKYDLNIK